jgi:tRNA1(Val) A37 N6-methylase TrmN6
VQELCIAKVDVIVCNPPYFKSGKTKQNKDLANARHEGELTLCELIDCSKRLLKENGKLMMVYKSCDLANVISLLDLNGFGIIRLQFVFDENKDNSTCFLLEAIKNRKHHVSVVKPVVIAH